MASSANDWIMPHRNLPRDGEEVWTMNSIGEVRRLIYDAGYWWLPDRSMYVYYVPSFWKPGSRGTAIVST